MKKFLVLLTVLCLMQAFWPAAGSFPTTQSKVTAGERIVPNVNSIELLGKIGRKSFGIQSDNVTSMIQCTSKDTKSNDVTNVFKQSSGSAMRPQSGVSSWAKTYGGIRNDYVSAISQTSDGSYIVRGVTNSFGAGSNDILILKLDSSGNIQWAKTYGGINDDVAYSISQTLDSGYIVAGRTESFGAGDDDVFILKLDSSGNIQWAKTYGVDYNYISYDCAYSISQTSNGGFIVEGVTGIPHTDAGTSLIIILDSSGNVSWAIDMSEVHGILETPDGGFIVVGCDYYLSYYFNVDFGIIKLDSSGDISWTKGYSGIEFYGLVAEIYGVEQTTDGGYVISGMTGPNEENAEPFIIKVNSTGDIIWAKTYGGSVHYDAFPVQTTDGGYIVAGETFNTGDNNRLILKLDSSGNIQWAKTYGGGSYWSTHAVQTTDGGYIVPGFTDSFGAGGRDILIIKLDSNGNIAGSSCNFLKDVTSSLIAEPMTPTVSSPAFTLQTSTLSVSSPTLTVTSPTLTVTSPTLQTSTICGEASNQPIWPMFHYNAQHTGQCPYDTSRNNGTLKWKFEIVEVEPVERSIYSSPTISADGTIYIGSDDHYLYAINPDGTLKWKFDTGGMVFYSSPALSKEGTIYIGSYGRYLNALNPDGTLKWKYKTGSWISSAPAISKDGTIYIGSDDHYLYAINPNGTLKWKYETGGWIVSSPAISEEGRIYMGSWDHYLYAINPNGTLKWKYETGWGVNSSPAISKDGTIYVGSWDHYLYALNPDGTLKWKYETVGVNSSPAISEEGRIYVGSDDGYLYALNPDGTLKWKFRASSHSGPAISKDGTIYVGSGDGYLYALNPDGTLKWKCETSGEILSSPAISSDGTIYIGTVDGYLYAIGGTGLSCEIELQKSGVKIDRVDVGESFDIVITNYTGNIKQVRFLSDESQNGKVDEGFTWTDWYDWNVSKDDSTGHWDADNKIKTWAFETPGEKEVWAEVKDNTGQTAKCSANISSDLWSFAIITDLHIGRGYHPNYSRQDDYFLIERLERVVEWINNNRESKNIKFLLVLGDISDSGEYLELEKAKDILHELDIPYIPVIGNHDIFYYTDDEQHTDKCYFEGVFKDQFEKLEKDPDFNLRLQKPIPLNPEGHLSVDPYYLLNYRFTYGGIKFIALDFNSRKLPPWPFNKEGVGSDAVLYPETTSWLDQNLKKGEPTILLSHHAITTDPFYAFTDGTLNGELNDLVKIIEGSKAKVIAHLAGHIHGFDHFPLIAGRHLYKDANHKYYNYNMGFPSITTEALMVGKNENKATKGIIRIVNVTRIDKDGINPDEIEGDGDEFLSLNPYLYLQSDEDMEVGREVKFTLYPYYSWHGKILNYTIDWGDKSKIESKSVTTSSISGEISKDVSHTYTSAGTYTINVTIYDFDYPSHVERITRDVVIKENAKEPYSIISAGSTIPMLSNGVDASKNPQNTPEWVDLFKFSESKPVGGFLVHFEKATEIINLSNLVADIDLDTKKSVMYMQKWPTVIEPSKVLYIPSTGKGAVYICKNAKSLEEVNIKNADVVINVDETKDGMTVETTFYNGKEYYVVFGVTGTGGGEVNTFTITASAGPGGTITPSGDVVVNYGSDQTFIITPNTGYHIKDVKVDGLSVGTVSTYTFNNVTAEHTIEAIFEEEKKEKETVIILRINNPLMIMNGISQEIDPGRGTTPVIIKEWGRTVVPIRAIVEALGGMIDWDPNTRKVTINFKDTIIELWIDNPKAKVNGKEVWIDSDNHNVKPIIQNGRTMLPLRFVTENLGCSVAWDKDTQTITITYPGS